MQKRRNGFLSLHPNEQTVFVCDCAVFICFCNTMQARSVFARAASDG